MQHPTVGQGNEENLTPFPPSPDRDNSDGTTPNKLGDCRRKAEKSLAAFKITSDLLL
jgi:hypothetical protein